MYEHSVNKSDPLIAPNLEHSIEIHRRRRSTKNPGVPESACAKNNVAHDTVLAGAKIAERDIECHIRVHVAESADACCFTSPMSSVCMCVCVCARLFSSCVV